MRLNRIFFGIVGVAVFAACASIAQDEAGLAMLSMESTKTTTEEPRVTAVYGVSADDYLPSVELAQRRVRPKVRAPASRPSLDLPDAFYFIGGPVFLLLFLRVLVIFLNGFDEKRKEDMDTAPQEVWDVE